VASAVRRERDRFARRLLAGVGEVDLAAFTRVPKLVAARVAAITATAGTPSGLANR